MAKNYRVEDLLDCIASLHPLDAGYVATNIENRLVILGSSVDLTTCKWTGNPPRSCNHRVLFDIVDTMTSIPDLQRMHACASIIAVLDDDESSISTSSISPDESTSSTSSILELFDCVLYSVRTPQYHETGSSTSPIIMDPLAGHTVWADVMLKGDLQVAKIAVTGGPGSLHVNQNTGEITYNPNPDGSEAGTLVYIHVRYTDNVTACTADVYLHLIITEETSTN